MIDFAARYTVADGGRTIDFPVGDLLNPVYETLDQMLVAQGQAPQFPRVRNESIAFLRDQEQETKLVLEQPLYEPRIGPAVDATRADADPCRSRPRCAALTGHPRREAGVLPLDRGAAGRGGARRHARRHAREPHGQLEPVPQRQGHARPRLPRRGGRARSGAGAPGHGESRAHRAELREPAAQCAAGAAAAERGARRRDRSSASAPACCPRSPDRQVDAPKLQDLASQRREELKSLDAAIAVGEARQDLARAAFKPSLAFGAEAGIQGTEYGFADEDRYVLASLVLRFNAFRGGADQAALREARALTDQLRATRELAGQRVRLEVQQALENFAVAEASLDTAAKRAEAATGAFTITSRKRDLGQINQAEFIDARRAQTDAQLNVTRVRAEYLARLAELEFSIGDARRLDQERM